MQLFDLLYLVVTALYLGGTALTLAGSLAPKKGFKRAGRWTSFVGFVLHGLLLTHFLASGPVAALEPDWFFKLSSWCVLLVFFIVWKKLKIEFLALIASPLALLLFLASLALPSGQTPLPKSWLGLFFGFHIGVIFVSLGLMALGFGAAIALLRLNAKLKAKGKLAHFDKDMPSLSGVDAVVHFAAKWGFPLYTFGLLAGFVWARFTWGKVFSFDPKEITSIIVWILYARLFQMRVFDAEVGRRPAKLSILVFALALGSMLVVNLLLPTHHSFTPKP